MNVSTEQGKAAIWHDVWLSEGASEPRNMGYMDRLGLWGEGNEAFPTFADFLEVIGSRGVGALEMVAMDMKARGMYVCRTLSFAGKAPSRHHKCHIARLGDPFSLGIRRWANDVIQYASLVT